VVAFVLLLAPPAAAAPVQQVDERGGVRAVVSYDCADDEQCTDWAITITRNGAQLVSEGLSPRGRARIIAPGRPPATKLVRVVDLNKDGEQEVIVDLFSGGAHCCFYSFIYGYSPSRSDYERLKWEFGDPGYTLEDLGRDRIYEFVGGNPGFAFAFTSFAESRFPIQIFRYSPRKLRDVTRRFPGEVRKDVRRLQRGLRTFRQERFDVRGMLAALQADYYLLGRKAAARGWKNLRRMARRGQIRKPKGARGPTGRRYIRSLHRLLKRFGYTR
jgi:hypothetical protein